MNHDALLRQRFFTRESTARPPLSRLRDSHYNPPLMTWPLWFFVSIGILSFCAALGGAFSRSDPAVTNLFGVAGLTMVIGLYVLARRQKQQERVQRDRKRTGCCIHCGYSLRLNTTGICPECGRAFPKRPPLSPEDRLL
jgi:hypothetical protein